MTAKLAIFIAAAFVTLGLGNVAGHCLLAGNGSRPLPNFVRPGGGREPRFENTPIQAIITTYRFNCSGVITEWRAFVEGSGGKLFKADPQPYSISFQAWRPSSPTNTYTLIGVNHFPNIPLADPDTADKGIVTGRPPESERIEVQSGDVIGFHLDSSKNNDDGIQFAVDGDNDSDYINEAVWSATKDSAANPAVNDCLTVGSDLTSSTSRAPLITVTMVSVSSSSLLTSSTLPLTTTELSSTTVVDQQSRFDSSVVLPTARVTTNAPTETNNKNTMSTPRLTTNAPTGTNNENTMSTPRVTTNAPTGTNNENTMLLIAFIVALSVLVVLLTLLLIIGAGIVLKKKANKSHKDNVKSISSSMTKNEAYGDISSRNNDRQTTWNLAYGETSAVGKTVEATVHSTQDGSDSTTRTNIAYGKLVQPQIGVETYDYACNPDSAICDPPTTRNPAYSDITITAGGNQDYYINEGMGGAAEVRMTRNQAYTGVRQPSLDNEHSITTKENEAYNHSRPRVSADPGRIKPKDTYDCV